MTENHEPTLVLLDSQIGFLNRQDTKLTSTMHRLQYRYQTVLSSTLEQPFKESNHAENAFIPASHTTLERRTTADATPTIIEHGLEEVHLCGMNTASSLIITAISLAETGIRTKILAAHCATPQGKNTTLGALKVLQDTLGPESVIDDAQMVVPELKEQLLQTDRIPVTNNTRQHIVVRLTEEERQQLDDILLQGKQNAQITDRALALLLLNDGETDQSVARKAMISVDLVKRLRVNTSKVGMTNTVTTLSNGRRGYVFEAGVIEYLKNMINETPPYPKTKWTYTMVSRELINRGIVANISPQVIRKHVDISDTQLQHTQPQNGTTTP